MSGQVLKPDPSDFVAWLHGLEQRVAQLEGQNVSKLSASTGPTPPMVIDLAAGIITAYDSNGTPRTQMGNLSQNGNSPAQNGLRVNAADGTPIFDGLGLMKALAIIGSNSGSGGANLPTGSTPQALSGISTGFNLSRTGSVIVFATLYASSGSSSTAPQQTYISVGIVGVGMSQPLIMRVSTNAPAFYAPFTPIYVPAPLGQGAYTAQIYGSNDGGVGLPVMGGWGLYVLQLGS